MPAKDPGQPTDAVVLLECEYIDKDYLDDYAKFYSRQFSNRGHKCARLHFFSRKIDHDLIDRILSGGAEDEIGSLQSNYLGFMVVKPLPKNFIGKTCLRRPAEAEEPTSSGLKVLSREYEVSLFGINLKVSSVGFQEQDKVVSACATTAIWATLHAMQWMALQAIPSHSQITTNAINFIPNSTNSFPSKELSNKQILRAFDVMGFRHHTENVANMGAERLALLVKAYIDSDFPLVLIGEVGERTGDAIEMIAGHAVTVLGYKKKVPGEHRELDALYVHDDRLGPYTTAKFGNVSPIRKNGTELDPACVLVLRETPAGDQMKPEEILVPSTLIVATPRNVRVPALAVASLAEGIGNIFVKAANKGGAPVAANNQNVMTFSYRLLPINSIKNEVRKSDKWSVVNGQTFNAHSGGESEEDRSRQRSKFLTRSFARYQWVVTASNSAGELLRILLDATDTPQGNAASAVLYLERALGVLGVFQTFAASPQNATDMDSDLPFLTCFLKLLKPPRKGLSEYLDATYGELRAPLYIKEAEIKGGDLAENPSLRIFYEATGKSVVDFFPEIGKKNHIWIVNEEGALVIGIEGDVGHPALTGSKPARIAGEIHKGAGLWAINSKSGRYSANYPRTKELLDNAVRRFRHFFTDQFQAG